MHGRFPTRSSDDKTFVDSLKKEKWCLPNKMSGHESHGLRHVPLEGGIIHTAVGNVGYISKWAQRGAKIFDDLT